MGRTKRPRRSFTTEFKAEVVALVRQPGKTAASVARDLDVTETAVRDWVKQVLGQLEEAEAGGAERPPERGAGAGRTEAE